MKDDMKYGQNLTPMAGTKNQNRCDIVAISSYKVLKIGRIYIVI